MLDVRFYPFYHLMLPLVCFCYFQVNKAKLAPKCCGGLGPIDLVQFKRSKVHSRPTKKSFQFIIDKIEAKLAGGKSKHLWALWSNQLLRPFPPMLCIVIFCPSRLLRKPTKWVGTFFGDLLPTIRKFMQRTGSGYAPKIAWGLGLRKARHNNLGAMATLNWKLSKHVDQNSRRTVPVEQSA